MEGLQNKKSQLIGIGIMMIIMIATMAYVLKDESPRSILNAIENVNLKYILIAMLLMCVYGCCEGLNIWISMKALGKKMTLIDGLGYGFVGFYFSSITPSASGGQPAQLFFMKRDGLTVSSSSLALMLVLFVHQFVVIVLGIIGIFMKPKFGLMSITGIKILLIYGFIANAAVLFGIMLLVVCPKVVFSMANGTAIFLCKIKVFKNKEKILSKISASLAEYERGAVYMRTHPKLIFKICVVTTIQILAFFSIPYVIYKGFHLKGYGLWDLIFAQAILNIAVSSLPLPGAVGASESVFLSMFRDFFSSALVIPGMLLTRLTNFYFMLVASGIISLIMYMRKGRNKYVQIEN